MRMIQAHTATGTNPLNFPHAMTSRVSAPQARKRTHPVKRTATCGCHLAPAHAAPAASSTETRAWIHSATPRIPVARIARAAQSTGTAVRAMGGPPVWSPCQSAARAWASAASRHERLVVVVRAATPHQPKMPVGCGFLAGLYGWTSYARKAPCDVVWNSPAPPPPRPTPLGFGLIGSRGLIAACGG